MVSTIRDSKTISSTMTSNFHTNEENCSKIIEIAQKTEEPERVLNLPIDIFLKNVIPYFGPMEYRRFLTLCKGHLALLKNQEMRKNLFSKIELHPSKSMAQSIFRKEKVLSQKGLKAQKQHRKYKNITNKLGQAARQYKKIKDKLFPEAHHYKHTTKIIHATNEPAFVLYLPKDLFIERVIPNFGLKEYTSFLQVCKGHLALLKNEQMKEFLLNGKNFADYGKSLRPITNITRALFEFNVSSQKDLNALEKHPSSPYIKVINFWGQVSEKKVIKSLMGRSNLEVLRIECTKEFTEETLKTITNECRNLKRISLNFDEKNQIKKLDFLSQCKDLEILRIFNPKNVSDLDLRRALEGCEKLKSVTIHGSSISDDTAKQLLERNQLEVNLFNCPNLSTMVMNAAARRERNGN